MARILVVDDEPGVRFVIRRLLDAQGYQVHEAGDGLQALEMVRAAPDLLDLVVSDLSMPRLNGIQLVQVLSVETPEIPFVLISGYAVPELAKLGIVAPCGMLAKPLVEDVFLAEVKRCLRQRN
jgi:two-component system, cell cycle sensor histidine kinase and response regulator CckA